MEGATLYRQEFNVVGSCHIVLGGVDFCKILFYVSDATISWHASHTAPDVTEGQGKGSSSPAATSHTES